MKLSEYQCQGHSLILVKGHSDFKVKCLTFGLYTQVSDSGPLGPLVHMYSSRYRYIIPMPAMLEALSEEWLKVLQHKHNQLKGVIKLGLIFSFF